MQSLAKALKLREVYASEIKVLEGYGFHETFTTYSFGWNYDGRRGLVQLCEDSVASLEPVEPSRLKVIVYSARATGCWEDAVGGLAEIVGATEDLEEFLLLAEKDPLLNCMAKSMRGLRVRRASVWYSFLVAVCQQNASFRQGWGMLYKLHLLVSDRLRLPGGQVYLAVPRPESLTPEVLRRAGLGYRARAVVEAVSRRVYELDCKSLDAITEVKGVGEYTYALVRLLACRDYSVLPLDRWLRRLASEAYGVAEKAVTGELRRRFGTWTGLAALWTTVAFDAEPLRKALERLKRGQNCPGLADLSPVTLWRHTPPQEV